MLTYYALCSRLSLEVNMNYYKIKNRMNDNNLSKLRADMDKNRAKVINIELILCIVLLILVMFLQIRGKYGSFYANWG